MGPSPSSMIKSLAVFTISLLCFSVNTLVASALTFKYFAYGSNCYPSTMEAMRNIKCLDSAAAILAGYKLRFNIPGIPGLEPSWACVEASSDQNDSVHGVLYTLTPQDFARVSLSEGVTFGYQWKVVDVVPYQGDGEYAGQNALLDASSRNDRSMFVRAYTLVSNNPFLWRDIPPSKAYRDLLIRGAQAFQMDQSHIDKLEAIRPGFTIGDGFIAKDVLEAAERRASKRDASTR